MKREAKHCNLDFRFVNRQIHNLPDVFAKSLAKLSDENNECPTTYSQLKQQFQITVKLLSKKGQSKKRKKQTHLWQRFLLLSKHERHHIDVDSLRLWPQLELGIRLQNGAKLEQRQNPSPAKAFTHICAFPAPFDCFLVHFNHFLPYETQHLLHVSSPQNKKRAFLIV